MKRDRNNRREKILQALAQMLEKEPGERITTAKLAVAVGVSEAALYRHFPSKGKILEGLIDYIEENTLVRAKQMAAEKGDPLERMERILRMTLEFAQKNPGMCRILTGEALAGETERLRKRVGQFFQHYETCLAQLLQEGQRKGGYDPHMPNQSATNLMLAFLEGKIHMFVRSDFKMMPLQFWQEQWSFLAEQLLGAPEAVV